MMHNICFSFIYYMTSLLNTTKYCTFSNSITKYVEESLLRIISSLGFPSYLSGMWWARSTICIHTPAPPYHHTGIWKWEFDCSQSREGRSVPAWWEHSRRGGCVLDALNSSVSAPPHAWLGSGEMPAGRNTSRCTDLPEKRGKFNAVSSTSFCLVLTY